MLHLIIPFHDSHHKYLHSLISDLNISNLDEVQTSVKDIVTDWKDLGLKLGLIHLTIEKINQENRGVINNCKREILAAWLKGEDNAKQRRWSTLVDALQELNEYDLAERIKVKRIYN